MSQPGLFDASETTLVGQYRLDSPSPSIPPAILEAARRVVQHLEQPFQTIRAKAAPRRLIHVELEPGSLFVMDYATQIHYTHGVPKTGEPVGERISLAFRVKRERTTPADASAGGFYR